MSDPGERVSDEERERAAASLKEHLLAGRLSTDEFSQRVGQAYDARVRADLELAARGLPNLSVDGSPAATSSRSLRVTGALLSHVVRRGRQRLRRWVVAGSVLGDLDLDLREATLERSRSTVNVFAAFGNADVYIPDQIAVTTGGLALIGHQRDHGQDASHPGAPSLHVRVVSLFGTVDVWRVPADVSGNYDQIVKAVRERQRAEITR